MTRKIAIVLFNLGGPDRPEAVQPFLFNLFSDPAILRVPGFVRWFLARLISWRRAPIAREIYAQIGNRSPIVPETEAQGRALEKELADLGEVKTFLAMRYWHPMAPETAEAVKQFAPDELVLLPLYPQYSTTTTQSSFDDWDRAAAAAGLTLAAHRVCCYPEEDGFIAGYAALVRSGIERAGGAEGCRVLFSAHGLPKKVVDDGDPYQRQVEATAAAVVKVLGIEGLDWTVCYQSRVGPLEWIGPSTEDEIKRAGADKKRIVLVPIAFVSEHSETLVELDIEYKELADECGVPGYIRVPAIGTEPHFIKGLGDVVRRALETPDLLCPHDAPGYPCPETSRRKAA